MTAPELETMARTAFGEARSEGFAGMLAVCYVIRNRASTGYRGADDVVDTCMDRKQFSCWNEGDPNRDDMMRADLYNPLYQLALSAAITAAHERLSDPTNGARHYHVVGLNPAWRDDSKISATIGHHVYYRGIA